MGLQLVTAPATLAVSVAEAKAHLRYEDDDQDALIEVLVKAAIENVEAFTGRALIDRTYDYFLDVFNATEIVLPKPPLIELVGVFYTDGDGDEQTVAAAGYVVDSYGAPANVTLASGASWPTPISQGNAVRIRFRAGYLNTDSPPVAAVPFSIKAAILLTVGSLFEHRETVVIGQTAVQLPWGVEQLLRPHRVLLGMA